MNKLIAFILGIAVGGVVGSYFTYVKVSQIKEDEHLDDLDEMREYYERKYAEPEKKEEEETEVKKTVEEAEKEFSKSSYTEYIKKRAEEKTEESDRLVYSQLNKKEGYNRADENDQVKAITAEEFAKVDPNKPITLYWFEGSKILCDADEDMYEVNDFAPALERVGDEEENVGYGYWTSQGTYYEIFKREEEYYSGIMDEILGGDEDLYE